jgi:tripartite-type tricarboxylate transporter receptor subunit TctC
MMSRFLFAALCAAVLLGPDVAASQTYPTRAIHIIVTFPPGGNADTMARLVADKLTQKLGQSVIVENKPGSASIVGTIAVLKEPADGCMLLQAGTNISTNPALGHKPPYDAERDLVPVVLLVTVPAVVVVNPLLPVSSLAQLIEHAKARPGDVNYGSAGTGSFPHLAMEKLAQETGIKVTHVPFRGFGPAMIGLLRNDIGLLASDIPGALEHIRAANCARSRSPAARACRSFRTCRRSPRRACATTTAWAFSASRCARARRERWSTCSIARSTARSRRRR